MHTRTLPEIFWDQMPTMMIDGAQDMLEDFAFRGIWNFHPKEDIVEAVGKNYRQMGRISRVKYQRGRELYVSFLLNNWENLKTLEEFHERNIVVLQQLVKDADEGDGLYESLILELQKLPNAVPRPFVYVEKFLTVKKLRNLLASLPSDFDTMEIQISSIHGDMQVFATSAKLSTFEDSKDLCILVK